ncbi:hypothetical protein [Nocardia gipuzkoensis]
MTQRFSRMYRSGFSRAQVAASQLVVVTADEVGGLRAQFTRRVLDWLDRGEVPVVEGIDLGGKRRFLPDPGQQIPPTYARHPRAARTATTR